MAVAAVVAAIYYSIPGDLSTGGFVVARYVKIFTLDFAMLFFLTTGFSLGKIEKAKLDEALQKEKQKDLDVVGKKARNW
jgi:hypothetical protein